MELSLKITPNNPAKTLLILLRQRINQLALLANQREKRSEKARAKLHGQMQTQIEMRLKSLTTKHLLDMLARHRTSVETCLEYDAETRTLIGDSDYESKGDLAIIEEYAIRKVLATRPHVPGKQEGKRNRRKMATQHHGSKKRKAIK